jgi:hypothetical protein
MIFGNGFVVSGLSTSSALVIQQGLVLQWGYLLEYLVVNRIVVKRVLFKWFKLRWVHGPNELVK